MRPIYHIVNFFGIKTSVSTKNNLSSEVSVTKGEFRYQKTSKGALYKEFAWFLDTTL